MNRYSVMDILFLLSDDSLTYHRNMPFSTKDADHDRYGGTNCAIRGHGAWWYKRCTESNLNGNYYHEKGIGLKHQGIYWHPWKVYPNSLKAVDMKMRPAGFTPGEQSNILVTYSRLAVPVPRRFHVDLPECVRIECVDSSFRF